MKRRDVIKGAVGAAVLAAVGTRAYGQSGWPAKDKTVSATHIKVETDANGVVQLSGTAKSQAEADKAVSLAKGVKGVTSVDSQIKVQQKQASK